MVSLFLSHFVCPKIGNEIPYYILELQKRKQTLAEQWAAYLYLKKFVKNLITNGSENLGKPHKY